MTSSRALRSLLISCITLSLGGCGGRGTFEPVATSTEFTVGESKGMTTIQFGTCTLVFEGIPSRGVSVGSMGTLNFPGPPGSAGGSETGFGGLKIKQTWDSRENAVSVNGYEFKLTDAGRKVSFADSVYALGGPPQTIVIDKDGKTRKQVGG
jgi:hypothetical protein